MSKTHDIGKSFPNEQSPHKVQIVRDFTVVVHGTFASTESWWARGGGFADALSREHPRVWLSGHVFSWTGGNRHEDRVSGGDKLAEYLKELLHQKQTKKISFRNLDIVTHSHGGNVAQIALKKLATAGLSVNNVVFIANPFVKVAYKGNHYDWLYFNPRLFRAVDGRVFNIWSPEDIVQVDLSDAKDGIPEEDIPNKKYSAMIDSIRIDRSYSGPGSEKITQILQLTRVGGVDAHSVLHSDQMGTAIGHLLNGDSWESAKSKAGLANRIVNDQ
jgi:pimeloyl-ACP methyl ester carboxylesterase